MSRVLTLEEARDQLPRLKVITRPVCELATSFAEELAELEEKKDKAAVELSRERLKTLVESWSGAVQELGGEVKGLWLVDFDSGDGCWCWAYPEEELGHWHSYEGGFGARVPIALKPDKSKAR